jgi:hypothetical protein
MEKKVRYKAQGYVLGNYWGGGTGAYPTIKITGETKEEVLAKAGEKLKDGGLDSGMGYESLIGAVLDIKCRTTVEIDGKDFHNEETEMEFIGELNEDQSEFLLSCIVG